MPSPGLTHRQVFEAGLSNIKTESLFFRMEASDYISFFSLIVSGIAGYYAWKAHKINSTKFNFEQTVDLYTELSISEFLQPQVFEDKVIFNKTIIVKIYNKGGKTALITNLKLMKEGSDGKLTEVKDLKLTSYHTREVLIGTPTSMKFNIDQDEVIKTEEDTTLPYFVKVTSGSDGVFFSEGEYYNWLY